jgi:hypothetical protein
MQGSYLQIALSLYLGLSKSTGKFYRVSDRWPQNAIQFLDEKILANITSTPVTGTLTPAKHSLSFQNFHLCLELGYSFTTGKTALYMDNQIIKFFGHQKAQKFNHIRKLALFNHEGF